MKKLINKVRLFFSPKLIKTIVLSTKVMCKHYQHWNKEVIEVKHIDFNKLYIVQDSLVTFTKDSVLISWYKNN